MEITGREIVERIDFVLKKKNVKRITLAEAVNIRTSSISQWVTRNSIPDVVVIVKIADYLDVDVRWLITGENPKGLSEEEAWLLRSWRTLSSEGKTAVKIMIDGYNQKSAAKKNA